MIKFLKNVLIKNLIIYLHNIIWETSIDSHMQHRVVWQDKLKEVLLRNYC